MPVTQVETLDAFDALVAAGDGGMRGWALQDLDLRDRAEDLLRLDPAGAVFLGCLLPPQVAHKLVMRGALLFPPLPEVPFDAYRSRLYTPTELYDGLAGGYAATLDARVYAWWRGVPRTAIADVLAQSLHDTAVDDALGEFAQGRRVVGVMGGHGLTRHDPGYAEAARLGRSLAAAGYTVATGGGPGAMEAANLGAALGDEPADVLDEVLTRLAGTPTYAEDTTEWAATGLSAVDGLALADRSLGVPTWFYGHEPPNVFATSVAKYFRNAIREDVLLQVATDGIVYLPGAAGTVQEIFQAACEAYYAEDGAVVPLVLVGKECWTRRLPAWPLLSALATERSRQDRVALVDRADEVLSVLVDRL